MLHTKSKKYQISLDNHSIIIGDYSKIIRRLFKLGANLGGSTPVLKKMDPRVVIYSKNVGKDPRSDPRSDHFLTRPFKEGPMIINE